MDERPGGPAHAASRHPRGGLDRRLCQVVGLNQNYTSATRTSYHIQIEDRGPVRDRVTEREVRRVNLIIYANYGEPNARIVFGRDHDFDDLRTQEHNRFVAQKIGELAAEARRVIEEKEQKLIARIKALVREYHQTRAEATKREFEVVKAAFPLLFSRAWGELKTERIGAAGPPVPTAAPAPELEPEAPLEEVVYPLDTELREQVMEIERIIIQLGQDLQRLKAQGRSDDILLQTCRKLVARAKESLSGQEPSQYNTKRLDMMRNSLLTTARQVRSRLK